MSIKPWKQTLVLFDGGLSRGSLFREPGWPVEGKIAERHELRSASISLAITWEWEYLKWSSICSHCGLQIAWAARWDSNILATLAPNGFSSAPLKRRRCAAIWPKCGRHLQLKYRSAGGGVGVAPLRLFTFQAQLTQKTQLLFSRPWMKIYFFFPTWHAAKSAV